MSPEVSIGSKAEGYPCPRCGRTVVLIEATANRDAGIFCAACQRVWREADEVSLADLDALPEADR